MRTSATLYTTIRIKASSKGTRLKLSNRLSCLRRLSTDAVATSFCSNNANRIKTAIRAIDPAIAGVVNIETVEVVTVEIINEPLNL